MLILSRSTFPTEVDSFVELFDLPPSLVASAKRYQELKIKPTLNASEQSELNSLTSQLGNYIITPETWNKFADSLVNVETFFLEEVDEYIDDKQKEWAKYVNDFHYVGVYNDLSTYMFQNQVKFNGDLYLCIKSTSVGIDPTNEEYWQKISTKGDKGDVGLNAFLRGEYNDTRSYVIGDAITYEGNIFYCIKDTTAGINPTNSEYWFMYDRTIVSPTVPSTTQQGLTWIEVEE
ncbi:hypothetical protein RVS70_05725 [Virgibacillus sp. M23]|uniref:hypothetical protein n=1 Tax=Virgibacillus sp. M23 TaxID=3079030 RepID=UPI002A91C095|nr:hypothetical protein [Virgibacillus sp. M23]MDY7043700.1 hypothetical protein [Virgibacillus sp. M23]